MMGRLNHDQAQLNIDPALEPHRAHRIRQAHLARAHWMVENYRQLLRRASSLRA